MLFRSEVPGRQTGVTILSHGFFYITRLMADMSVRLRKVLSI